MKKNRIVAIIALGLFLSATLFSCHRNTCPTFGKEEIKQHVEEQC